MKNLIQIVCVLVALVVTSPVLDASPDVEAFADALSATTSMHKELKDEARTEAFQKTFFNLSVEFPVLADWILQDAGADAWQIVLPERRATIVRQLFHAHGRSESSSLKDYLQLCEQRRATRLASVIQDWAPFSFTEGETIRNSFFGYTEGLSDARAERYFKAGARLSIFAFDEGSLYGSARPLIEDPHGMMRDVDISFDQERLAFAWKKSDRLDDYHVYEYYLATGDTKQLTFGLGRADYEPIYLPDGDLDQVFHFFNKLTL